ncbi:peptidase M28 [Halobellus salinus]|uniref:Peptidase M28 n=1 Tax=Halobellus salinus TaxID=931585 RepID=A0A830EL85_9EURY|nr:M28 family peptidase [Halobellus salinus]GGJ00029.1 peptidase M28 [Halobellus salinus]SMP02052.1 Peptidase family M28 [Halobellus salinus]
MLDVTDRQTERTLRERVDPAELNRHVDALEGLTRVSGSADERRAATYVVDTLREYGVDATLHEYETLVSVPESASVTVTAPDRRPVDAITVSFGASTPDSGVSGPVVTRDRLNDADGGQAPAEGKILLAEGLPRPTVVQEAAAAGAEALVCQSPSEHLYQGIVTPVWGTPSRATADRLPNLPVVEVTATDGAWLREQVAAGPVELTVATDVRTELATLPCPVGRIHGRESDRFLLIGNHIDSWFEGMTDNATAVAATLEVARVLSTRDRPLRRGVRFGFWPAHSTGRYAGSARYADDNWLDLRDNGLAYLHLDLLGLQGADTLWYQHMAELGDEHLDAMAAATDLGVGDGAESYLGGDRPARNSDQSFWGTGLSSLLSGARLPPETDHGGPIGGGWWWHTSEDTRDKVDIDVLAAETRLYLTLAARICESPVPPHDFRAAVADVRAVLDEIGSTAGDAVTFADEYDSLEALRTALDDATRLIEARVGDQAVAADAEDLQVRLSNLLTPALYTDDEPYEQEPAAPHDRLPSLRVAEDIPDLTGRERRFAEASLRRGRNRLLHALDRATRVVESFVSRHE